MGMAKLSMNPFSGLILICRTIMCFKCVNAIDKKLKPKHIRSAEIAPLFLRSELQDINLIYLVTRGLRTFGTSHHELCQ